MSGPTAPAASADTTAQTPDVLRIEQACIGYDDRTVVRDLNLTIHRGEVVALLGTNGAGKSTLVRGLLGLAEVQSGTIELFDGASHARSRVGYVPQRQTPSGPVPATVTEIVMTGRLAGRRFFIRPSRADRQAVASAIEVVGLTRHASSAVTELSGGQHRRALIARALTSGPELLVLDEPTAGVDASQQHAFVRTLTRLAAEGVTMLIVTHEIGPMVPLITRVLVLEQGRLSYDGPIRPEHTGGHGGHHHHADDAAATEVALVEINLPTQQGPEDV